MQHEDNFFRGCCFLLVHCIENSSFSLWCLYYIFFKVNCFRLLIKKDWYFEQTLKVFSDIVRSVYPGIYHFTFLTECFPKVGLFKRLIWFYQIRPKLVHGLTDTIIRTKKTTTKNITITKTRVCYFFRAVYQNKNHVIPHPDIAAILDVILNILPRWKEQQCAVRILQPNRCRNYQKIGINCNFNFRLNVALKRRPSWHPLKYFNRLNQTNAPL